MFRAIDINAGRDLLLAADGDITLESSQDLSTLNSQNQSSGASIGVAFSFGSSNGISFSASANQARGYANGDDTIQQNTHVTAARAIQIQSGADTTLAGATIAAPTVKADTGGNLRIESRQDTSTYTSAQKSSGMGVTLCIPPLCYGMSSVSGSTGKQNVNSDYRSVTEQSGIRAGDGGFKVNVGGNTTLTGGAITSSDLAVQEGLNSFVTGGTLTTTDIQNRADYKADGYSVSMTVTGGGSEKPPEEHKTRTQAVAPVTGGSAGIGQDSGDASSVTKAGISGIAGDATLRTGDAEKGIAQIFDKDRVQKEIDAQIKITAEFGKLASKAVGDYAKTQIERATLLQNQAAAESDPDKRAQLNTQAEELVANWGDYGTMRLAAHTLIGGLTGGTSGALGAATGTLSAPAIANALQDSGITGPLASTITALGSTLVGTAAGGVTGASTALNEVANNYLKHAELDKKKKELAECGADSSCKARREAYWNRVSQDRNAQMQDSCIVEGTQACRANIAEMQADLAELVHRSVKTFT